MPHGTCPVPSHLGVWELAEEPERSTCSVPKGGKDGSLRGWWPLAVETLLLLSLPCDPYLPLLSSPVLTSAPSQPSTLMFGVTLGNFESWTEMEFPTWGWCPCLLCYREVAAYPGVLQWLFCIFCCYSTRLKYFNRVSKVLIWSAWARAQLFHLALHGMVSVFDKFMSVLPSGFLLL